ncbi:hypothetical protein [Methylobacterium sp. J-067]|uniref:hypothetical protein n=1 Tax=Methylobacterium sp. J-067 TaxID=2836648 RepID=UPI001FBA844E|nr:hypothetical protein [Methylobacterium sp. J-067]MCJ2026776.1 hypothetical protein [Methylobacterium sp. J-067]
MKRIGTGYRITFGLAALAIFGVGAARAEPPIRSPEDAACRGEARSRVFSTPNPRNLPIEELGKGIYYACMARIDGKANTSRKRARRHRVR